MLICTFRSRRHSREETSGSAAKGDRGIGSVSGLLYVRQEGAVNPPCIGKGKGGTSRVPLRPGFDVLMRGQGEYERTIGDQSSAALHFLVFKRRESRFTRRRRSTRVAVLRNSTRQPPAARACVPAPESASSN